MVAPQLIAHILNQPPDDDGHTRIDAATIRKLAEAFYPPATHEQRDDLTRRLWSPIANPKDPTVLLSWPEAFRILTDETKRLAAIETLLWDILDALGYTNGDTITTDGDTIVVPPPNMSSKAEHWYHDE